MTRRWFDRQTVYGWHLRRNYYAARKRPPRTGWWRCPTRRNIRGRTTMPDQPASFEDLIAEWDLQPWQREYLREQMKVSRLRKSKLRKGFNPDMFEIDEKRAEPS